MQASSKVGTIEQVPFFLREISVMQTYVIEPGVQQALSNLSGYTLLCDSEGNALGIYQPMKKPMKAEEMRLESPRSLAEIEERRKSYRLSDCKTTEEVLKKWES